MLEIITAATTDLGLELDWRLMARHYSENARPGLRSSDPLGTENTRPAAAAAVSCGFKLREI